MLKDVKGEHYFASLSSHVKWTTLLRILCPLTLKRLSNALEMEKVLFHTRKKSLCVYDKFERNRTPCGKSKSFPLFK